MSGPGAIVVLVEHAAGEPTAASLAALEVGRGLADSIGAPLEAVILGEGAVAVAATLGRYGIGVAHVAHDGDGEPGRPFDAPAVPGLLLARLIAMTAPRALLGAATTRGNETLANAAALTNVPLAAACLDVRPAPGSDPASTLAVTRLRWGGSVLEEARLDGATVLLTIADGAATPVAAEPALAAPGAANHPRISTIAGEASASARRVRLIERVAPTSGVDLATARVVVGGGRGVGGPEAFGPIEELAALLGGTVGVSRVVTSAGWRPHAEQVGQTGTRIAPDLYIACGISGAIQHIVGCRGAKAILAINTDQDAPIMARANYGVLGDLHAVVPAIIAELRRRQTLEGG